MENNEKAVKLRGWPSISGYNNMRNFILRATSLHWEQAAWTDVSRVLRQCLHF